MLGACLQNRLLLLLLLLSLFPSGISLTKFQSTNIHWMEDKHFYKRREENSRIIHVKMAETIKQRFSKNIYFVYFKGKFIQSRRERENLPLSGIPSTWSQRPKLGGSEDGSQKGFRGPLHVKGSKNLRHALEKKSHTKYVSSRVLWKAEKKKLNSLLI